MNHIITFSMRQNEGKTWQGSMCKDWVELIEFRIELSPAILRKDHNKRRNNSHDNPELGSFKQLSQQTDSCRVGPKKNKDQTDKLTVN